MKIVTLWEPCPRCDGSGREEPIAPWDEIEPTDCLACEGRRGSLTVAGREIDDLLRVVGRLAH